VRATKDVDLLVVVPSHGLPEDFSVLRRFGVVGEDRALVESPRERHVAEMSSGLATVDVLVPVLTDPRTHLDRAVTVDVGGGPCPNVSASRRSRRAP
jgi:hypothetical protein